MLGNAGLHDQSEAEEREPGNEAGLTQTNAADLLCKRFSYRLNLWRSLGSVLV